MDALELPERNRRDLLTGLITPSRLAQACRKDTVFRVCLKERISIGIRDAESKQTGFCAAAHEAFD